MKVYLVRHESGCYSDHLSYVERVYSTREAAIAYVESIEWEYERCIDENRFEEDDAWENRSRVPDYAPVPPRGLLVRRRGPRLRPTVLVHRRVRGDGVTVTVRGGGSLTDNQV